MLEGAVIIKNVNGYPTYINSNNNTIKDLISLNNRLYDKIEALQEDKNSLFYRLVEKTRELINLKKELVNCTFLDIIKLRKKFKNDGTYK